MSAVARANTERAHIAARKEALHLIVTLWEHRAKLPSDGAYPLAPLRELISVVSLFAEHPDRPWWGYHRDDPVEASVFRAFARLMPALLFMRAPVLASLPGPGDPEYEQLDDDEKALLNAIDDWLEPIAPEEPETLPVPAILIDDMVQDPGGKAEQPGAAVASDGSGIIEPADPWRLAALSALTDLETGLAKIRARLQAPRGSGEASETPENEDSA